MKQTRQFSTARHEYVVTPTGQRTDKVQRYRWQVKDQPGTLMMIPKGDLKVDPRYQREPEQAKVAAIRSAFSWVGFGALIVAKRGNEYYVIDGGHRLAAAMARSDVQLLPCVVFETSSVVEEARGFINTNVNRKPMDSLKRFKAAVIAQDPVSLDVKEAVEALGMRISNASSGHNTFAAVGWAERVIAKDRESFYRTLSLAHEIASADEQRVDVVLLNGIEFLDRMVPGGGLENDRLRERLKKVGAMALSRAAERKALELGKGGAKQWGLGMLVECNKGLRHKIQIRGKEDA